MCQSARCDGNKQQWIPSRVSQIIESRKVQNKTSIHQGELAAPKKNHQIPIKDDRPGGIVRVEGMLGRFVVNTVWKQATSASR